MRLAWVALVAAACGSSGPSDDGKPEIIASVSPTSASAGDLVEVSVTTKNFKLVDFRTNTVNMVGEGHFHVYIDDSPDYLTADFISPTAVQIPLGTSTGAHMLKVELANNDHTLLDPEVFDLVPITVTP